MSGMMSEFGTFSDMPAGPQDVRCSGRTGSKRRALKARLITHNGHRSAFKRICHFPLPTQSQCGSVINSAKAWP
jgi:hypothetical protein